MASVPGGEVQASCALCGAPAFPECPHEGEALEKAFGQAMQRWDGWQTIREWVISHARNQILDIFHDLRAMRMDAHTNYLQSLPYYNIYHKFNGAPPLTPQQLAMTHQAIDKAQQILQHGVDQDWRTACQHYPQILDYYFGLITPRLPSENDPLVRDPRFNPDPNGPPPTMREPLALPPNPGMAVRRVKASRDEFDERETRRARRAYPPVMPQAPMPGAFR